MLNMLMSILQPSHPDDIKSWLVYAPERGKKMFRKIYWEKEVWLTFLRHKVTGSLSILHQGWVASPFTCHVTCDRAFFAFLLTGKGETEHLIQSLRKSSAAPLHYLPVINDVILCHAINVRQSAFTGNSWAWFTQWESEKAQCICLLFRQGNSKLKCLSFHQETKN